MRACDEVTYDSEADALYMSLACEWSSKSSEFKSVLSPSGDVVVDIVEGKVVGIEVLSASRKPQFALVTISGDKAGRASFRSGGSHPAPSNQEGEE